VPNIKSAKKRVLVNEKKKERGRAGISALKTAVKKFNNAIDTNNIEEAEALLPATYSIIDSSVSKGLIHKNNAANKKSALAKRLYDVKTGKKEIVIKKDNKTIAAEKAKAAKEAREAAKAEFIPKAAERKEKAAKEAAEKAKTPAAKSAKESKSPAANKDEAPKKLTLEEKLKVKKAAPKAPPAPKKEAAKADEPKKAPAPKKAAPESSAKPKKETEIAEAKEEPAKESETDS
jgi:small subunit ribosomal protein S20